MIARKISVFSAGLNVHAIFLSNGAQSLCQCVHVLFAQGNNLWHITLHFFVHFYKVENTAVNIRG